MSSFGTGSRPPLMLPTSTPGPGAYPMKSTLSKSVVSNLPSPAAISLKSRQKFGDPYERAMSKTTANEPGPGQYGLNGKFASGANSEKYSFPKCPAPSTKFQYAPGPGAYDPLPGLGKQVLSTRASPETAFMPTAKRSGLEFTAASDVGP
eukprot:gene59198-78991_t